MKTYTEQEQKINLAKLAHALRAKLPVKFDMSQWGAFMSVKPKDIREIEKGFCGSVGCALGVATYVIEPRMPKAGSYKEFEDWLTFSRRLFGFDDRAWHWIFAAEWAEVDNTPEGAAARIEWYLAQGVPKNAGAQMDGDAPLCYKE